MARARLCRAGAGDARRLRRLIGLSARPTAYVDGVRLRIVQPNQPQDERFQLRRQANVMAKFIALSERVTGPQSQGLSDVTT